MSESRKLPNYSESQKLGKKAADICSLIFSEFCSVMPVPQDQDIGIDFKCEIIEEGYPTNQWFNVQCKGTKQVSSQNSSVMQPIKVKTLNYWLGEPIPTFLVLVDCTQEVLYWVFPQTFLSALERNWQVQESISLPIPIENCMKRGAISLPYRLSTIVKRHKSAKPRLSYGETLSLHYSSIVVDGIFLNDLIHATRNFYSKIYSDKELQVPSIYAVANHLLEWVDFPKNKQVMCHIILPDKDIHDTSGILDPEKLKGRSDLYDKEIDMLYTSQSDCDCLVSIHTTQGFVWSEVEKLVDRFTNVENLLLVANEPVYHHLFDEWKEKNIEMIWTRYPKGLLGNAEECIYPGQKWINAAYPIARSMGIERHEL